MKTKEKTIESKVRYDDEGIKGLSILASMLLTILFIMQSLVDIMVINIESITNIECSLSELYITTQSLSILYSDIENSISVTYFLFCLDILLFLFPAHCLLSYFFQDKLISTERYKGYRLAKVGILLLLLRYLAIIIIFNVAIAEAEVMINIKLTFFGHLYWVLLVLVFLFFLPLSSYAAEKRIELMKNEKTVSKEEIK